MGEDFFLLSNGREGRAYIEPVDHEIWINPRRVLVALSKDVLIILQEEGKLLTD